MTGLRHLFRGGCIVVALTLVTLSLGSCQLAKNQVTYDRSAEKDRQGYRDALAPQPLPPEEVSSPPDFQSVIAMPEDLKLPSPLVTVSVNQTVSLRDLMFELGEQAGIDLEMDPQIRGSIIFTAKDRPFREVIERITEMAGLRYTFEQNVLRVELDRPYIKNYRVDYMNIARKSTTNIKSSISVASDSDSGESSSGSDADIENKYEPDFWKEINDGLKQILTASDTYLSLATLADPVATPVPAYVPPPLPVDPNNPAAVPPPLPPIEPPTLNVSSTSEPLIPNPPSSYSISKQTGIVSVFASERQHKMVKKFMNDFEKMTMTQVLIEARVLEVSLSDEFAAGIDWGQVSLTGLVTATGTLTAPTFSTPTTNVFTANIDLNDGLRPVLSALSRFGSVRALSSPRVMVLNNQPAVVNVSNNRIYFDIQTTQTASAIVGGEPTVTRTGTVKSTPEGVLMNVLPTANLDTGEIILAVRPTVSKITAQIDDPLNDGNLIPELSVQEIDSIVKLHSGQTMVMGGLMREDNTVSETGIPVLGDIPMVGALFRNHGDNIRKSELVILMRATIVPGGSNADDMDRKIYQDFGHDRRPVRL